MNGPQLIDLSSVAVGVLDVTPADTDGRSLRLHQQPTGIPAVAFRPLVIGATALRLEVLAASHRVRLRHVEAPNWELHETVACEAATAASRAAGSRCLPGRHEWQAGRWRATFHASIAVGADAVADARAVVEAAAVSERSLIGRFPGHPDALTALVATGHEVPSDETGPTEIGWRTWHLYPGSSPHVVTTTTTVSRATARTLGPLREKGRV